MFSHCIAKRNACALAIWLVSGAALAQELTLAEAQRLAESGQPQIAARRSASLSALESAVAARELPDPKLRFGVINVPADGPDALSPGADFMTMTMVGVMQEFPRRAKRDLRGEMLNLTGERSLQETAVLKLQFRRDAALAWFDAWAAARAIELAQAQQREQQVEIDALVIALRNNRAAAAELSEARVALELLADRERLLVGDQRIARAALARWIGERAQDPLPQTLPELPRLPGSEALARKVETHPYLATIDTQVRIADADAALANLSTRPDWSMELSYGRRGSAYSNMVSLQFQVDLPILQHKRQDRSIAAKFADVQQAREMREDAHRELRADALQLHARSETEDARAQAFSERVLPEARKRLDAATASYRSGKGKLSDVLAARRALLDLELETLLRQVEAAKARIALDYFARANGEAQ